MKRCYPFGYRCERGEIVPDEAESKIVQWMFEEYEMGSSLRALADSLNARGIVFKEKMSPWSKSRVQHILTDERYIGGKGFPPIVEPELFGKISRIRESKYVEVEPASGEIRFLQKHVVCGECGSRYVRKIDKKGARYWVCEAHCDSNTISENYLLSTIKDILTDVASDRTLLESARQSTGFQNSSEIVRLEKEWSAVSGRCGFEAGKTLLLQLASKKFSACREDKSIYTETVYQAIVKALKTGEMGEPLFREVIRKVRTGKDGSISIEFANGAIVARRR